MLERLVLPPWLRISLALPLLTLNLWVLRQLLLPLAPFPALFLTAALLAFLLDLPTRWLLSKGLSLHCLCLPLPSVAAELRQVLAGVKSGSACCCLPRIRRIYHK